MSNEKEKDKKGKDRFLSPSFRKGVVKDKKEEEDDGEFKINLIAAENDDDGEESKSPSPNKHRKKNKKIKKIHITVGVLSAIQFQMIAELMQFLEVE